MYFYAMDARYSRMRALVLGMCCAALATGCMTEEAAPHLSYPSLIQGEWTLARAYRNASETRVLDGTYFHFRDARTVDTNLPLPGQPRSEKAHAAYRLSKDSLILQTGTGQEQLFLINTLDSQRLVLSTLIMDHAFQFDLVRE